MYVRIIALNFCSILYTILYQKIMKYNASICYYGKKKIYFTYFLQFQSFEISLAVHN